MTAIKLKRSANPSSVPSVSDLQLGELAVNTYDGKIYLKQQVGTQTSIISVQPLRVSTITGASIVGEVQNISALRFDSESNFILTDLGGGAIKVSTQNLNPISVGTVNTAFVYSSTVTNISSIYFSSDDGFVVDSVGAGISRVRVPNVSTATNLFSGSAYQIPYQSNSGITSFITAPVTTGTFLSWNGSSFAWSPTLTVSNIDLSSNYTNTVTNVSILRFDTDSGFDVVDLGNGAAKIQLNSTFKYFNVDGNPGLTAEGLDTVNFIASTGTKIVAYTTGSSKSLTFSVNTATSTTVGGVKPGSGIDISADGTISVSIESSNNLVWSSSGNYRTLTGYIESGTVLPIRTAEFFNNLLRLTIATFTPSISAVGIPGNSLNWDIPATGFTATADNPSDFTSSYISSVLSLTTTSGSAAALGSFTAGSYNNTPAPGVDWNRSFTNGWIRPTSTTITGGSAGCIVTFNVTTNAVESQYTASNATFTINWNTPTMSISLASLTGQNFLGSYTSVAYTASVTGMTYSANYDHSIGSTGGTVSNSTGSGTFTFTTPIHKNNTSDTRTVTNTATFTRPVDVTGVSYSATLTNTTSNPSATFTYPSFWVFTSSTSVPPTRADVVNGFGFEGSVTVLGNQVKTFSSSVNNPQASPQAFWFGVRTSASQPTTFRTGASASLLSGVSYTSTNVSLEPDTPGIGYTAEGYSLYGITLQPGSTYVDIG